MLVLAGGIVMGIALGIRHVQGLFLLPITLERGWSRETFGLAMAVQNLVWGLAQPFAGMAADRWGAAKVIAAGIVFYALGLFLMAQATTPVAFLLGAGLCIGIALSGTAFGVVYGALSRLMPPERRGWALGMAGAVGGFGQFAMVPVTQGLLGSWSWVSALLALRVAARCRGGGDRRRRMLAQRVQHAAAVGELRCLPLDGRDAQERVLVEVGR